MADRRGQTAGDLDATKVPQTLSCWRGYALLIPVPPRLVCRVKPARKKLIYMFANRFLVAPILLLTLSGAGPDVDAIADDDVAAYFEDPGSRLGRSLEFEGEQ